VFQKWDFDFLKKFQPKTATAASIAARAAGFTEMMYLPFAPRSMAEVGTAVAFRENIVRATINIDLYLVFPRLRIFLLSSPEAKFNRLMVRRN